MLGLFVFGMSMSSCISDEQPKQYTANERVMSLEEAIEIVAYRTELRPQKETNLNTRLEDEVFNVINSFLLSDKNGLPAIYGINYTSNGTTLFSFVYADKNVLPIIAYGEGKLTKAELNPPLMVWAKSQIEVLEYARDQNLTKKQYIDTFIGGNVMAPDPQPLPNICDDYQVINIVGPLMTSTWGQGCVYNNRMDITCIGGRNDDCDRNWAGCVAVAIGQIMNFHNHPANYNWNLILDSYDNSRTPSQTLAETNEVSRLILDIGNAVNMSWGCGGSGAKNCSQNNTVNALTQIFDYTSANACVDVPPSETVKQNINYGFPVIFEGTNTFDSHSAHAWVCDGYKTVTYCSYNAQTPLVFYTYLYYHMNWGWRGQANGYFTYPNFRPFNGTNYTDDLEVLAWIRP